MLHDLFYIAIGIAIFLGTCLGIADFIIFLDGRKKRKKTKEVPDNKKTADDLLAELTTALQEEQYERAAQIRDELNSRKKITNE